MNSKLDFSEFDRIVGDLYNAAAGRIGWNVPLDAIARALNAYRIQLLAFSKSNGALLFSHFGGDPRPEGELAYVRHYHRIDPRPRLLMTVEPGRWLHCHEHFDDEFVAQDPFYQEFLIPQGGRYVSGTKVREDDSEVVIFSATRGVGQQPFDAVERDYLDRIQTHFVRAVEIYKHLRLAYSELATGRELLNQFRYPMILIDAQRGIQFRNRAAQEFVASTKCVVDRHGVLGCRKPQDETELTLTLQNLRLHADAATIASDKAFLMMSQPGGGGAIAVHVIAIRPQAVMHAFGATPLALLVFHDPHDQSVLDPFIVGETFDLTPAEARVAIHIANGKTPDAIAADTGVSIATVRSQLQAVFQKTGTNRQADLVRLLAGVPDLGIAESGSTTDRLAPDGG